MGSKKNSSPPRKNLNGTPTRICITGATGFIGSNLLNHLKERDAIHITALSRRLNPEMDGATKNNVTWRRCDGFSLLDAEQVTEGCDTLIYLIHSMLPTTSLTQGSFSDFDLYLADNFARAAHKNGVKNIIYLGGLLPTSDSNQNSNKQSTERLSEHLASRLEVERVLGQYGANLISLRSGLIIGKNGSSFRILEKLVRRLPCFIFPAWTRSQTQPIELHDVLATIDYVLQNPTQFNGDYDIGGPDVLTYQNMITSTAKVLKKRRPYFNVPLFSPGLSKLWVSKITGTPHDLVYPLVESLKHNMVARKEKQLIIPGHKYTSFQEALKKGIDPNRPGWVREIINYGGGFNFSWLKNVASIQRVRVNNNIDTIEVFQEYFKWLPSILNPFIKIEQKEDQAIFYFLIPSKKFQLLRLQKSTERSGKTRHVYYVIGGVLADEKTLNGRLEFRYIPVEKTLLLALLNFRPWLPWFIYKYTQAILHSFIMNKFTKYIQQKMIKSH